MSLLAQFREQLRLWWELCENKKTAAEKIIIPEVAHLHDALVALEGKVVIIEASEARRIRDYLKTANQDTVQLEAAIGVAEKAQAEIDKTQAAQQPASQIQPPATQEAPAPVAHD